MRHRFLHILILLMLALLTLSCDRTPRGVMSVNDMAELIADLHLAEAYMDLHHEDFQTDSNKQAMKQSVFKKHGINQADYDTSLVWYAHNMEEYTKAYDKAVGILKEKQDKLDKAPDGTKRDIGQPGELVQGPGSAGNPAVMQAKTGGRHQIKLSTDITKDSVDLWQGDRQYLLTQGAQRGFITFDVPADAAKQRGDRYQLAYKLTRGMGKFKVSLNVDYTDGATAQMSRVTNSDGWVTVDVQSDTARQVRRIYGYVSYDIERGHVAYVDSLSLMRTRMSTGNYGYINAQRLLERNK